MSTAYTFLKEIQGLDLRRDTAGVDLVVYTSLNKLEQDGGRFMAGEILRKAQSMGCVPVRVAVHSLAPGRKVEPHTDELDGDYTRLHFPVTAPVHWWDEDGGDRVLELGIWSEPVPYNRLHSVHNPEDRERITVIVDFEAADE